MAAPEDKSKFNLAYLVAGEGPKDWYKAWGSGVKILIPVLAIALFVYIGFNWGWQAHAKRHPANTFTGPTTVIQSVPEKKPPVRLEFKLWWLDLDLHGGQPK